MAIALGDNAMVLLPHKAGISHIAALRLHNMIVFPATCGLGRKFSQPNQGLSCNEFKIDVSPSASLATTSPMREEEIAPRFPF